MIKGYLKILFLKKLKNKDCTGYDFMQSAEKVLGKKPSAGSVYPLLKQLLSEKFIKAREEDRKKIYSITKKGEKLLIDLTKEKKRLISSHQEIMGLFKQLGGCKSNKSVIDINKKLSLDNQLVFRNLDVLLNLKKEINKTFQNSKLTPKKEQELRQIIQDTIKRIKQIR